MQRRKFLTASAASAAMLALGDTGNATGNATGGAAATRPDGFSRARFQSWLHDEFRVTARGSGQSARATLIAVDDGAAQVGLEQFSAVFRGDAPLPIGLCWLAHPDGSRFMLHLDATRDSLKRRACFSLLGTHDV